MSCREEKGGGGDGGEAGTSLVRQGVGEIDIGPLKREISFQFHDLWCCWSIERWKKKVILSRFFIHHIMCALHCCQVLVSTYSITVKVDIMARRCFKYFGFLMNFRIEAWKNERKKRRFKWWWILIGRFCCGDFVADEKRFDYWSVEFLPNKFFEMRSSSQWRGDESNELSPWLNFSMKWMALFIWTMKAVATLGWYKIDTRQTDIIRKGLRMREEIQQQHNQLTYY